MNIAIVVPAHNAERTLNDCLHSIKIQTSKSFLIVVDDASTDKTQEIASQFADIIISNPKRLGKGASVNQAVEHIQHQYTLVVDADTYLERKFIKKLTHTLQAHKYKMGSGTVEYIGRTKYAKEIAKGWQMRTMRDQWRYNGCCQFFETELLKKEGYNEECLVEDEEIYWRLQGTNGVLVEARAYSEAPLTPKNKLKQFLRWERGAFQLARWNLTKTLKHKYKVDIISRLTVPIFFLAFLGYCLWFGISMSSYNLMAGMGAIVCFYFFFTLQLCNGNWHLMRYTHYVWLEVFIRIYVFFEVFLFNRKLSIQNW